MFNAHKPVATTEATEKKKSVRKKKIGIPKAKSFATTHDVQTETTTDIATGGFSKSYDRLPASATPLTTISERKSPRRKLSKSFGKSSRSASPASAVSVVDAVIADSQLNQQHHLPHHQLDSPQHHVPSPDRSSSPRQDPVAAPAAATTATAASSVHNLQQLHDKRSHEPTPKNYLPAHGSRSALAGANAHVAQLRNYNNVENPEEDYDDEFFWGSSEDEDADVKPVVFGHFRNTADLVQHLGEEKPLKKRRQFRTANSDDSGTNSTGGGGGGESVAAGVSSERARSASAAVDGSDEASGYDDVERALQSLGIAELLANHGGKQKVRDDDMVTSSSESSASARALRVERVHDDSDSDGDSEAGDDEGDDKTPAHVAARKARSARHHALSQDSSDSSDGALDANTTDDTGDWIEAESERTLVEASKALGVARVYPPRLAVTQMSSFHVDYTAVSALDETRIHVHPLASRMPFEPVSFRDIPVPRFATTPSATLAGTLVIPPGFVVSHFNGSSAVHVRDLLSTPQHSERWLLAHESPIVQIACIAGMIVALLADDTLLMHDVHGAMTSEWTTDLKCGPLFRSDRKASGSARASRCLLVSEACLVIVADAHFFMWTWRSLLYVGTSVETMPAPSISFALDPVDEKLMPRADFSTLDLRGHVLLGGNQGFVLYDIAAEAPLFRYELSTAFAIASFHAVRWSGECVVTLEAAGVRIWRVFPLAGVQELGGGTASESGVAPRVPAVTARSPPELIAPDENTVFTSLYADADCVLIGDSLGRVRFVPLASGPEDDDESIAARALDRRESAKMTALTTTTNANDMAVKMSVAAARAAKTRAAAGGEADDDDDNDEDDDDDDEDSDCDSARFELEDARGDRAGESSGEGDRVTLDQEAATAKMSPDELNERLLVVLARVQKQGAAGLRQALREGTAVWRLRARDGQTLLHHAATHGLLDVVQLIVKKAPRAEFTAHKDDGGRTALHAAAAAGHVAVVEELIRRARLSLLDADTREGMSPLHLIARMSWNTVTMPRLLALVHKRASGKVDPRNKALETPLHQACLRGEPEMVRWLLDVGASIDAQKDTGETPLHLAARRGSLALIRLLLDRGANPQLAATDGRVPRDVADGLCSEALARAMGESEQDSLTSSRALGDESPRSPATSAEEPVAEHSSLMARLLGRAKSGDVGGANQLAMVTVGKRGDEAAVRELLRKNATALFAARDKHGQSVLHTAAFAGHAGVVKLLVRHKKCPADMVQLCDKNGWTPLHAAASIGELSICNELIDHGADLYRPTAQGRGGTTSAHYLARLPWTVETEAVWRRVFSVRCETDVRDAVGRTPLFDAASKNRAATIRFLLAQGADGNARAHDGSTALHTAVASNAMDAVQALITANVELLDADEIGTARSLAHTLGVADIAELLDGYHHTLYSVASPRSKQFMQVSRRARARASPSVAAVPHRSVAAVHRAPEYINVASAAAVATATATAATTTATAAAATTPGANAPVVAATTLSASGAAGAMRAAEMPTRVMHLGRDGDRVFCGQENGAFTMWSLAKRNARKPLASVQCGGPVRVFVCRLGQVLLLSPLPRDIDGDDNGTGSGQSNNSNKDSSSPSMSARKAQRRSVRVLPRQLYELTAMQWGHDSARSTFDARGRPLTAASTLLSQCEVSLWMRISLNDKGLPAEFDEKHLLQPWSERGIVASLLAHRSKIAAYVDASATTVKQLVDHGTLNVPYALLTQSDVSDALGRLRRDHLPLAPRSLRGANDGLHGAGAKDVALPFFMTVNRGGGFMTLYTLWSSGQRIPAPPAILRAIFTVTAAMRCGTVAPGTGIGKLRGPAKRVLKGDAASLTAPPTAGSPSGATSVVSGSPPRLSATAAAAAAVASDLSSGSASSHLCATCGLAQLRMCTFEPCGHSVCCATCGLSAATCARCSAKVERIVVHKV